MRARAHAALIGSFGYVGFVVTGGLFGAVLLGIATDPRAGCSRCSGAAASSRAPGHEAGRRRVAVGILIGLAGSIRLTRFIGTLLTASPQRWTTYVIVLFVLAIVTGCFNAAGQTSGQVDPISSALRISGSTGADRLSP